jgi:sugar lactone lactonase YvrE
MRRILGLLGFALFLCPAWADDQDGQLPHNASYTTLLLTGLAIEGLTGDNHGNLYTTGRTPGPGLPCPVWRINVASKSVTQVGTVPAPSPTGQCSPSGLAFDREGKLFITETDKIYSLFPDEVSMPVGVLFAAGVPGTNGLAFDHSGNLWTGDGTTGQGRVWKITPSGLVTLELRVPPMRNGTVLGGDISVVGANEPAQGVGRQARTYAHTAAGGNPQDLVANGLAFNRDGDLFIADTARGAIWKVDFDRHGNRKSRVNCDTTFAENTLCFDNIFVAHPLLDGTDGIALDREGNIWNSANERNAIVVVTRQRRVVEIFRNPPDAATGLRNGGPLETPTSPVLMGRLFCTANSDGNRRDNFPNTGGEVKPAGPAIGKVSCMEQQLRIPGLRLPL